MAERDQQISALVELHARREVDAAQPLLSQQAQLYEAEIDLVCVQLHAIILLTEDDDEAGGTANAATSLSPLQLVEAAVRLWRERASPRSHR